MEERLWQYVMSINPFIKKEEIKSIEELDQWEVLITFYDGRKIIYDTYVGGFRDVFYDDINELTDEQEKREFAHRLRIIMERNGFTQETLAEAISSSQTMIHRYTSGQTMPNVMILRKIAKVLNVSMDDFFYKKY